MAGRPKGSISRKSKTAAEICSELKFDPIKELIKLRNNSETSPELKEKICSTLLPYLYPRLTAVTVSGDQDNPLTIKINPELQEMIEKIVK